MEIPRLGKRGGQAGPTPEWGRLEPSKGFSQTAPDACVTLGFALDTQPARSILLVERGNTGGAPRGQGAARLRRAAIREGGIHPRRGRLTVGEFVTDIAGHDDNHLDQLRRALEEGRVGL